MRNKFLSVSVYFLVFLVCAASCDKTALSGSDSADSQTPGEKARDKQEPQSPQTPGTPQTPESPQTPGSPQTPESPQTPGTQQTPGAALTTWYVSENGNDSASGGGADSPLATVSAALGRIKALYRGGKWPQGQSAVIIVSGRIMGSGTFPNGAMVDVSGAGNYPPIILRGDPVTGGVLDANRTGGAEGLVMYIANNKVTLEDKLVLTGGRRLWGGGVCIGTHGIESRGEFVMAGGEISGNKSGAGGGVMVYKGSMSMLGGVIKNNGNDFNHNGGSGGGVYLQSGDEVYFTMSGGKIEQNGDSKTENGGGLYIDGNINAVMTGGEITGNSSLLKGGGVYIAPYGEFTMSAGTVSGN
ncbi:MAG: hypothetical protein LBP37_05690, partial [Spirochaetaceae bacterium]|nr:hypothetical protein [Spirochaetaceae bacterium]